MFFHEINYLMENLNTITRKITSNTIGKHGKVKKNENEI
jgi:hypothetical protein